MPFLHEGNDNVTITQLDTKLFNTAREANRLEKILQREALATSSARVAAHRKLQMAKMMGNGGGGGQSLAVAALNFQRQNTNNNHLNNSRENDPLYVASRRARSNNFTLKETFDLLKIWASDSMQYNMKHNFRNFRVWEAISLGMHEMGHERTAIQCKNRIQNLTSIYYRIKKSKQDYRSFNFPYYKLIGDILEGKKHGNSGISSGRTGGGGGGSGIPSDLASLNHSAFSSNGDSPSGSGAGFAAHLALVEEYQHLINGNPEVYITQTRNSSSNSNSGLNVLSPEVSLSEGNSPIRVEHNSRSSAAMKNGNSPTQGQGARASPSFNSKNGNSMNGPLKMEHDDSVTVTVEDSLRREDHENGISDIEDSMLAGTGDERDSELNNESFPAPRTKRSFSASFGTYSKPATGLGPSSYNPAKRPRVTSSSTNSGLDDPVSQYLAEMVEIERQFLDLERERAENERHTMMYFMQILQALISPASQTQDDDNENENDNDNEGEVDGNENDFGEDDNNEDELRQMIENEEEMTGREDGD